MHRLPSSVFRWCSCDVVMYGTLFCAGLCTLMKVHTFGRGAFVCPQCMEQPGEAAWQAVLPAQAPRWASHAAAFL